MIIGLCGIQGSGKDTVGSILINEHNFIKLSFAGTLKDTVAVLFSWPRDMLEGATEESRIWRETIDPFWAEKTGMNDFTPRKALQYIGTDLLRDHLCKDIWSAIVENKINMLIKENPKINIVITDCRFTNEFNMLKKFNQCQIIRIDRDTKTKLIQSQSHSSEIEWLNYSFDNIISNNGTIDDLKDQIKNLIC